MTAVAAGAARTLLGVIHDSTGCSACAVGFIINRQHHRRERPSAPSLKTLAGIYFQPLIDPGQPQLVRIAVGLIAHTEA